ncbi:MAG: gamma-glutamylcyclotransferase family protein [Bacteroidota bacterium]
MDTSSTYIFAYGTLRSGFEQPLEEFFPDEVTMLGKGTIQGLLYLVKYYPGLILPEEGGGTVFGEVYELSDASLLEELDQYEGINESYKEPHLYKRKQVEATLENGEKFMCWTYCYNWPIESNMPLIESGDFADYRGT